ncbi:DUF1775 domain-containing protein [Streptomyces sp. NPDC050759]|uniref:DUF1775 domain-containing protein n=1 Tax=Streptomyces sp. NPDC050759 TaxID=3365635 RepID=UPI00378D06C6
MKATSDGCNVAGPALKAGVDAEHEIKVRPLPDAKEIAFKTIEVYSDGKISRWIELPTVGEEPQPPSSVLKLKAAAPGAGPVGPSPTESATPSRTPSATESDVAAAGSEPDAKTAEKDDRSSTGVVSGGVLTALAVLIASAWWLVKRWAASSES